jgi:hypothetical protein
VSQIEALLLSIALEVPVALAFARFIARVDVKWALAAAVLATLITHPFVWHFNETLTALAPWPRLSVLEVGAFTVEGAVYLGIARMKPLAAWGTSLAANAFSFGTGLVVWFFFFT